MSFVCACKVFIHSINRLGSEPSLLSSETHLYWNVQNLLMAIHILSHLCIYIHIQIHVHFLTWSSYKWFLHGHHKKYKSERCKNGVPKIRRTRIIYIAARQTMIGIQEKCHMCNTILIKDVGRHYDCCILSWCVYTVVVSLFLALPFLHPSTFL